MAVVAVLVVVVVALAEGEAVAAFVDGEGLVVADHMPMLDLQSKCKVCVRVLCVVLVVFTRALSTGPHFHLLLPAIPTPAMLGLLLLTSPPSSPLPSPSFVRNGILCPALRG